MKKQLCLALAVMLVGHVAMAADFYTINSVESSTGGSDLWASSNLIQGPGAGFDAAEPHAKTASGPEGDWVTADDAGFPSDYVEAVGMPVLTFDLGSDVALNEISVWGYSAGNTNGVSEFNLSFATDAEGAGGGSASAGPFTTLGSLETGENNDVDRQSFSFSEVSARYVSLTATDNYFVAPGDGSTGALPGGDRVGLGEVGFQVVPEPGSSLLILTGLLGLLARRRKK